MHKFTLSAEQEARKNQLIKHDTRKQDVEYAFISKITGMVYIGWSNKQFETRLKQHIKNARNGIGQNSKFYNEIRKNGIESFDFVILEFVPKGQGPAREKELIQYHDTFRNGYNSTSGGEGGEKADGKLFAQLYEEGYEVKEIAAMYNYDKDTVRLKLQEYGYDTRANCTSNRGREILMCDIETGEVLERFCTISDAGREMRRRGLSNTKELKGTVSKISDSARVESHNACGYKWRYADNSKPIHPNWGRT